MRRALCALALLLALAGCTSASPAPAGVPAPPAASAPAGPVGGLRIPAIGVDVDTLVPLGLDERGAHEVPPDDTPEVAGYYTLGPAPGDDGPAIILGHVNGRGRAGVFARLHELQSGDRIVVGRGGAEIEFVVDAVTQAPKTDFPVALVYGPVSRPELRLITCGGALDRAAHSYLDNVIVTAHRA